MKSVTFSNGVSYLIKYCNNRLSKTGVENPLYISEYLLSELFNCKRFQLYAKKFKLSDKRIRKLAHWLLRIRQREPVQYITNSAYFMGLKFYVDKRSFIPRPETELLVEEIIRTYKNSKNSIKGLDLGTGCGNIAISIAKYLSQAYIIATDLSMKSIEVAQINVARYNLSNRICLKWGDIFEPVSEKEELDFIVSNPPYVSLKEIKTSISPEVRFEPEMALNGGQQGLVFHRKIIKHADKFLKPGGYIFLEIGDNQACSVYNCVKKNQNLKFIKFVSDYNDIKRIVVAKKRLQTSDLRPQTVSIFQHNSS